MSKYLPALFVICLSASLGYLLLENIESAKRLAEYQNLELEHLYQQKTDVDALLYTMLNDIEDEIDNEGKRTNIGLRDTLQMLQKEMDYLSQQETISDSSLSYWENELEQIYQYNYPAHWEQEDLRDKPSAIDYQIAANRKWRLMSRYIEVLDLLNGRLGVACKWGLGEPTLTIMPQYGTADTLAIKLGISRKLDDAGLITYWEFPNTDWTVTDGKIETRGQEAYWVIPIEKLASVQTVTCKMRRLYGRKSVASNSIKILDGRLIKLDN